MHLDRTKILKREMPYSHVQLLLIPNNVVLV